MEEQRPAELIPMGSQEPVPTEFDVVLRGYDRRQVDEYLDRIEADLAAAQAERSALATRTEAMQKQLAEQDGELTTSRKQMVESAQPTYAGLGQRVQQLLTLAEQEAADIRAKAEEDATKTRADAEHDVAHLREHADSIICEAKAKADAADKDHATALAARREQADREDKDKRMAAERQHHELVSTGQQQLDQAKAETQRLRKETEEHTARLRSDADDHAAKVTGDAENHSSRVRNEAEKHAESLVSAARADADRLVREAEEHRASLFATAKDDAEQSRAHLIAEIQTLEQRRDGVHQQINALRQALGGLAPETPAADGPAGAEQVDVRDQPAPQDHTQVIPTVRDKR